MSKQAAMEKALALIERTPDSTSKYVDETLQQIVDLLKVPDAFPHDFTDSTAREIYYQSISLPPPMAEGEDEETYNDMLKGYVAEWRHLARMSQAAASWLTVAGRARRAVDASTD